MDFSGTYLKRWHAGIRLLVLATFLLLQGCGYHTPSSAIPADKHPRLAIVNFQNHTGVIGLESDFLQELYRWFSQGAIMRLSDEAEADYILDGTLVSLRNVGQTYDAVERASELLAILRISYKLRDKKGKIFLQTDSIPYAETYEVGADAIRTRDNRRQALNRLFDDLAEDIYLQILMLYDEGEKL
jgi:outer membrane lipopolysaccharide assembly protein LptE/RlpB